MVVALAVVVVVVVVANVVAELHLEFSKMAMEGDEAPFKVAVEIFLKGIHRPVKQFG